MKIIVVDLNSFPWYTYTYKNINDLNTKFYLTALKSLTLAQRTSAGCMIMFYNDLLYI